MSVAWSTFGRPSGGLACILRHSSFSSTTPALVNSNENLLAVRIADLILINVYFPCGRKSVQSLNKFAKTASPLGYQFVVAGNFNADLLNSSIRSDIVFYSLSEFKLVGKNRPFSYIHHSGSLSNIDHVLCSPNLSVSTISVHQTESNKDHLPISFMLGISLSQDSSTRRGNPRWFTRRN